MSGRTAADRNAAKALGHLLQLANVRATALTVRERLEDHPDFPALSALSDVLTELRVNNLATRLTPDRLPDVPLPALMQVRVGNDEQFAPLRHLNGETVEWLDTATGCQREPFAAFVERWTGIALLIEPDEQAGERDYPRARRRELLQQARMPLMVMGIVFCLGLLVDAVWATASAPALGLLLIKGLGTLVSGLLVAYSLDANNPALRKLCTFGKSTNCQSILQSEQAKIWGDFGWADVGLLYFTGGFITLAGALLLQSAGTLPWLLVLTALALPYTVWSVYYQAFVARQFCTLCLTVQALLWVEAGVGYTLWLAIWPALGTLWPVLGTFLAVTLLWLVVRKPIHRATQLAPVRRELRKIKFSETYLRAELSQQAQALPYPNGLRPLVLGNPNGTTVLIMVTNPMCEACKISHKELIKLLPYMPDLRCEIILVASQKQSGLEIAVAKEWLRLQHDQTTERMNHWFLHPTYSVKPHLWQSIIQGSKFDEAITQQLRLYARWAYHMGVDSTPTFFLSSKKLPNIFRVSDLLYIKYIWSSLETNSMAGSIES